MDGWMDIYIYIYIILQEQAVEQGKETYCTWGARVRHLPGRAA